MEIKAAINELIDLMNDGVFAQPPQRAWAMREALRRARLWQK
ncbi:hypothetical protein ACW9HW_04390 [Pseudomonas sp. SDO5532_S415]